jgi:hypothetical protein
MRQRASKMRIAFVVALAAVPVAAALAGPVEGPNVQAATTGNDSELVKKIEIKSNPGKFKRVMKLTAERMPPFLAGDKLRVSAELGVTTDCYDPGPRCTGSPYSYDPEIDAKVVLTNGQQETTLDNNNSRCRQQPDDRQHHCLIIFHGLNASAEAQNLACQSGACRLEVFARAHNPNASGGDVLIIGGQQEDGTLSGDKGRINVIRLRGNVPSELREQKLQQNSVPPDLKRRVIISLRLNNLEKGDVIEGWADIKADVGHLPYHALVGSEITLTDGPKKTQAGQFVKQVSSMAGELTETGGENCTQAQTPCPVFRTGVLTMREDAVRNGNPVPLYLNLVVRTNNKEGSGAGDQIKFKDQNGLKARVYERE